MSTSWEDVAHDMAISDLHQEAVMARAVREQCIFLFVEGESEETAIPILMTDVVDLDALGVKIANYNGHGNLRAALRLLKLTLSHNRPVIITYDNDPASIESVERCKSQQLFTDTTYELRIPIEGVVTYKCGHCGGSFEESFPPGVFLDCVFNKDIFPPNICSKRSSFESIFDRSRPWVAQVRRFAADLGFTDWDAKKVCLAEYLALEVDEPSVTYRKLAELVKTVREKYPVVHPDDVELPKVYGLTYFPDKKSPNNGVGSTTEPKNGAAETEP